MTEKTPTETPKIRAWSDKAKKIIDSDALDRLPDYQPIETSVESERIEELESILAELFENEDLMKLLKETKESITLADFRVIESGDYVNVNQQVLGKKQKIDPRQGFRKLTLNDAGINLLGDLPGKIKFSYIPDRDKGPLFSNTEQQLDLLDLFAKLPFLKNITAEQIDQAVTMGVEKIAEKLKAK